MSKMDEKTREMCLRIMNRLMKRPSAAPFLKPVDVTKDETANYLDVIKHPMDLSTILNRLSNGEYSSVTQWEKDMNLVWNNAEKFFKKGSMICLLGKELEDYYEKQTQKFKISSLSRWSKTLFSLKTKLEQLFEKIPPLIGALGQNSGSKMWRVLTEHELKVFVKMAAHLENPLDAQKMAQILKCYAPECSFTSGYCEIDVNDLPPQALHALQNYAELRLDEMNMAYA